MLMMTMMMMTRKPLGRIMAPRDDDDDDAGALYGILTQGMTMMMLLMIIVAPRDDDDDEAHAFRDSCKQGTDPSVCDHLSQTAVFSFVRLSAAAGSLESSAIS